MTDNEYDIGYYLDMISVTEKTERIIDQHKATDSAGIKSSLIELIAIYYSKPFMTANRAYARENGSKHRPHKLTAEEIDFTQPEHDVHQIAYNWRNGYVAHSDQTLRQQSIDLKYDEKGKVTGFASSSGSIAPPLCDFHLDLLNSNLKKIRTHLWSKIINT